MAYFLPARALYARHGFVECGPFGDYREDPNSVFMTVDARACHRDGGCRRNAAIRALTKGLAPSSPPPPATCPQTEGIGTSSTREMSFASARASDTGK